MSALRRNAAYLALLLVVLLFLAACAHGPALQIDADVPGFGGLHVKADPAAGVAEAGHAVGL